MFSIVLMLNYYFVLWPIEFAKDPLQSGQERHTISSVWRRVFLPHHHVLANLIYQVHNSNRC